MKVFTTQILFFVSCVFAGSGLGSPVDKSINTTFAINGERVSTVEIPKKPSRYILSTYQSDWLDAIDQCKRSNSELATIQSLTDAEELNHFLEQYFDGSTQLWLGAQYKELPGCSANSMQGNCWVWEKNPATSLNTGFMNFVVSGTADFQSRLTITNDPSVGLSFSETTAPLRYICDTNPTP